MLDVVESGLDQVQDARARLLMAMVTLSQTSTTVITETETSTVTPSCVSAVGSTFSECTGGWYTTSHPPPQTVPSNSGTWILPNSLRQLSPLPMVTKWIYPESFPPRCIRRRGLT